MPEETVETSTGLSRPDADVLNLIQEGFPLCQRPFKELADKLGSTEEEIIERVRAMKDAGVIRRLGASFDSRKLGYESTLVAMHVPDERLDEVGGIVSEFPQVTHNYGRRHYYNLWFALVARNREELVKVLAEIKGRTGIADLHEAEALRTFKIRVKFDLGKNAAA